MSYYSQTAIANLQGFDKTFTAEFDKGQNAVILTPTSGKSIIVKGFYIGASSAAGTGKVRLYGGTNNNTIGTVYAADNTSYSPCYIPLAQNETIKCQDTVGDDNPYFILINYSEVPN